MAQRPKRKTVDLSQYPDLIVIYLGMLVNALTGVKTLLGFGPKISGAVEAKPDGLLLHENLFYSLRQNFLRDSGGTGFWHETYMRRGGMEAVYVDMEAPTGMMKFAPVARGDVLGAQAGCMTGEAPLEGAVSEQEFYASSDPSS